MDCGFQVNAFQQNAFQMCIPVPPPAGGQIVGNLRHLRYVEPLYKLPADPYEKRRKHEDEEIVIL